MSRSKHGQHRIPNWGLIDPDYMEEVDTTAEDLLELRNLIYTQRDRRVQKFIECPNCGATVLEIIIADDQYTAYCKHCQPGDDD